MRRRLLATTAACLLAFTVLVPSARAHGALVRADPPANAFLQRAPAEIVLSFSEPLAASSSSIRLLDGRGAPVATPGAVLSSDGFTLRLALPVLKPGVYNVLWANVSRVDGHGLRGSYPFTVLNPDGTVPDAVNTVGQVAGSTDPVPQADGIAVRALSLLGLVLAAAGALLLLLLPPGAAPLRALGLAVLLGAALTTAATALNLAVIDREYAGLPLRDVILDTRIGGYWLARLGAGFLIAIAVAFLGDSPRGAAAGILGAIAIYLWAFAATSHAAAGAGSNWATSIDLVHAFVAIAWIGAVVGLLVTVRLQGRGVDYGTLMPRFATLASACVFLLLATGALNGLVEVDAPGRLTETRYGKALLVKLALMVVLLAVAAYNARWGRALVTSGASGSLRRFRATVAAEAALGLAVFVLAAVLTQTTASRSIVRQQESRPFDESSRAGDLTVGLKIDPNRTGFNTYRVALTDGFGNPVPADRVRLTFRYREDQTVGASTLTLAPLQGTPGAFGGNGPYMTLEGQWRLEAGVRRADADDAVAFFDVRPAGVAVVRARNASSWANPAPGLTWNEFGGLTALMTGLGLFLSRSHIGAFGRWAGRAGLGASVLGFGAGFTLLFGVHPHEASTAYPKNPIVADENSIAQGRRIYQQNCIACHGTVGIPPRGLDLNPPPLDLTIHVPQHPDGQLFNFVSKGVEGTAMRAWGEGPGALTEEQLWHTVNFLRTLTPTDE